MKKFLLFAFVVLNMSTLWAQNQVVSKLIQPPPNKFGIEDLWLLELNNTTKNEIKGYVVGTLSEDKDGLIIEGRSKLFIIKPGRTTYTYKNFSDADIRYHNNRYKEILLRTGGAPDGDYTICITVYNEDDEVIGQENCIYHSIRTLSNIVLNSPEDNSTIEEGNITFSWIPLPNAKEYSLKIVEVIGRQSPTVAMRDNRAFYQKDGIRSSTFQYPTFERPFEQNKTYAWQVYLKDNPEQTASEIWTFRLDKKSVERIDEEDIRIAILYDPEELEDEVAEEHARTLTIDAIASGSKLTKADAARVVEQQLNNKDLVSALFPENSSIVFFAAKKSGGDCPPPTCGCEEGRGGIKCVCIAWRKGEQLGCICDMCYLFPNSSMRSPHRWMGIKNLEKKTIFIVLGDNLQMAITREEWWNQNEEWFVHNVINQVNSAPAGTNITIKTKSSPRIQGEFSINFLFLYREGSVSDDTLRSFVESTQITIKQKSRKARDMEDEKANTRVNNTGRAIEDTTEFEQMTIDEFVNKLLGKGVSGTGVKDESSNSALKSQSPTLGELFQKHGPVLVLNVMNESTNLTGDNWIKVESPGSKPYYVTVVDIETKLRNLEGNDLEIEEVEYQDGDDIVLRKRPGRTKYSNIVLRTIVITFNQTDETIGEFKELFCRLYHNDCGRPIGKPTPLSSPVNIRRYFDLNWNEPLNDEEALRSLIRDNMIINDYIGFSPTQEYKVCLRRLPLPDGRCVHWRICGNLKPDYTFKCYDIIWTVTGYKLVE